MKFSTEAETRAYLAGVKEACERAGLNREPVTIVERHGAMGNASSEYYGVRSGIAAGFKMQTPGDANAKIPSDHLGARIERFADLARRVVSLASQAEQIEIKIFGHRPPEPGSAGGEAVAGAVIQSPHLSEQMADIAHGLNGAINRLETAVARIQRHIE